MSRKANYSEDQIDAFFKKVTPPLAKSKETLWDEVFHDKLQTQEEKATLPNISWYKKTLEWDYMYRMVAVFAVIFSISIFIAMMQTSEITNLNTNETVVLEDYVISDDTAIIESLFMEDQEVDEYLSAYVINQIVEE